MRSLTRWLIARASRDTASGQFIAEIDGLRFIAIMSVVLFHLSWFITSKTGRTEDADLLAVVLSYGDIGVQLFFIISGFVIALPFAKGHLGHGQVPPLKSYLLRRLTRLEPPYIANLLIRFLLLTLVAGESPAQLLPHLLASVFYLHNAVYGAMSSVNFVAWSLEIELQFYLLAPIISTVFRIGSKTWRRLVLVGTIVVLSLAAQRLGGTPRFDLSLLSSAQFFLTGFLLVDLYLADWGERPRRSLGGDLASLAGWGAFCVCLGLGGNARALIAFPMFLAYLGAFRGTWSNRFFTAPPIYIIGGMCYTIYLYHYTIISALIRPLLQFGFWHLLPVWAEILIAGLIMVPLILLLSTLFFVALEKPCMKKEWYRKLLARARSGVRAEA
ncbi:acyltransferase family protein [Geomesophilobacter sediminis]|uniref:Acyltransferase n=1 Tax=Geomesophilobacter sediminis TaxID=2798584 RepID=A0A8J7SCQ2_9BACT|nr:acyltransferase [Geomesophilobacter sediminis]MBJ6727319.1 acyltransferase [Geomesophilobacter sediminis]